MNRILITGATGNIGVEVIKYIFKNQNRNKIIAGVRNIDKAKKLFYNYSELDYIEFDFENQNTFDNALLNIDTIFLLRPPHISDVEKYFKPLINMIKENGINEVVFLSVQGVEKSSIIPHNKIEKLIEEANIDYIFLRPSYFMQNLTTTLIEDIRLKRKIILPAGKAKFNWIDIENIGEAASLILDRFEEYKNRAFEITGNENENFYFVEKLISSVITDTISYESANPLRYYLLKKKDGVPKGLIIVMIMLHFLPRFQKEPRISNFYERLTGNSPTKLSQFVEREKEKFSAPIL
jgi:uncharacterized protein YbjT (DUF2867 family)